MNSPFIAKCAGCYTAYSLDRLYDRGRGNGPGSVRPHSCEARSAAHRHVDSAVGMPSTCTFKQYDYKPTFITLYFASYIDYIPKYAYVFRMLIASFM